MRHDILLAAVLAGLLALPITANAQDDPASDVLEVLERGLVERLCAVDPGDELALATCLVASAAVLGGDVLLGSPPEAPSAEAADPSASGSAEPGGVLDRARQAAEEALSSAQQAAADVDVRAIIERSVTAAQAGVAEVDLGAALDQLIGSAQDVDLDAALDAAISATSDVDVEAAVADAVARIDETISAVDDVDVAAWLEDGVRTTRSVVAESRRWAQDNADIVCAGSGLSTGTAAAAVVAYLTGSPGLALRAFEESERLGTDICLQVAEPSAAEANPGEG
jgi:hypothetical protein